MADGGNCIPHMKGGDGKTSYSNNSLLQRTGMLKAWPFVEDAIHGLLMGSTTINLQSLSVADLGCSSGPNTLRVVSQIIHMIHKLHQQRSCSSNNTLELLVFLNDLPGNDFNAVFKSLPEFHQKLVREEKGGRFGPCFVFGVPGTFYGRLFPNHSLHFVHSAYAVHWLSKVPEGVTNNKGNIYMASTSPFNVFKAYKEQFQRDFSLFLTLRSEEVECGGRMVLTIIGRTIEDPTSKDCCYLWELLSRSLLDMVAEGLIEETSVDSFNIPIYTPFKGEVAAIVKENGCFNLDKLEVFAADWDPNNIGECDSDNESAKQKSGQVVACWVRAIIEPMLTTHFGVGEHIIDRLFDSYAKGVTKHLATETTQNIHIVITLVKAQ